MNSNSDRWPELRYEDYNDTRQTLHMYTQVIGKIRLALTPPLAQWAHAPLRLSADGLTTTPLWVGNGAVTADIDLIRHETRLDRSDGRRELVRHGTSVADYYRGVRAALNTLGIPVAINPVPQEVSEPIPFDEDTTHHVYEPEQANLIWQTWIRVASVFDQYASGYWGKQGTPGYFWGGGDFGVTRFSGRQAQTPQGLPRIMAGSLDAESLTHTFMLGNDQAPAPAFVAMGFPLPSGIEAARVEPAEAAWMQAPGMPGVFALGYDVVRTAPDPRATLLSFLRSTYEAFAEIGRWDRESLEKRPPSLIVRAA
jgi:Family of unknown function (DUF5996)